jgi:uncharacterized protein (DUF697 family)
VSVNEMKALETVKHYMWWSMGAGLIPVPGVDLAAVSGAQLKMIAELSKIYDVPFHEIRGKAAVGSLVGYVFPHALSYGAMGCLLKFIPVVGALAGAPAMALFSGASAWALGNVFIQHFESGGTFLDFDPERVREYFKEKFEEGRNMGKPINPDDTAGEPA